MIRTRITPYSHLGGRLQFVVRRLFQMVESLEGRTLLSAPHFDHVVVVMEENESYGAIIGWLLPCGLPTRPALRKLLECG